MIEIDQAVDIERQQDVLATVDGEVARATLGGHDLLYQSNLLHRVRLGVIFSQLPVPRNLLGTLGTLGTL